MPFIDDWLVVLFIIERNLLMTIVVVDVIGRNEGLKDDRKRWRWCTEVLFYDDIDIIVWRPLVKPWKPIIGQCNYYYWYDMKWSDDCERNESWTLKEGVQETDEGRWQNDWLFWRRPEYQWPMEWPLWTVASGVLKAYFEITSSEKCEESDQAYY